MEFIDGSEDCAICFDPVHAEDRLPLPCRCQLTYCLLCWDRALAAAFNDNGQARCPSCRRPVRVDFDPEAGTNGRGRLVFSLLSGDDEAAGSSAQARSEMVNRLAEQAAPLMTRLLRKYGEGHPTLRATAQDPARALAPRPIDALRRMLRSLDASSEALLGVRVTLRCLKGRSDLNGAEGIVSEYLQESGRFRVALTLEGSAAGVSVKRANLSAPAVEQLAQGWLARHRSPAVLGLGLGLTLSLILPLPLPLPLPLTLPLALTPYP